MLPEKWYWMLKNLTVNVGKKSAMHSNGVLLYSESPFSKPKKSYEEIQLK